MVQIINVVLSLQESVGFNWDNFGEKGRDWWGRDSLGCFGVDL